MAVMNRVCVVQDSCIVQQLKVVISYHFAASSFKGLPVFIVKKQLFKYFNKSLKSYQHEIRTVLTLSRDLV